MKYFRPMRSITAHGDVDAFTLPVFPRVLSAASAAVVAVIPE